MTHQAISELFNRPLVFIDIETTGMRAGADSIIEVGALRIEDGEVVAEMNQLLRPEFNIPYFITNITGITDADVADAPEFAEIADQLYSLFADDALFIAHNARFDYSFISNTFEQQGTLFAPDNFCTVRFSRALYAEELKHSLETIIRRHNIAVQDRHRAYEDARVLWEFMNIAYEEKGHDHFAAAAEQQLAYTQTETLF